LYRQRRLTAKSAKVSQRNAKENHLFKVEN
jgi:hypothetical protein